MSEFQTPGSGQLVQYSDVKSFDFHRQDINTVMLEAVPKLVGLSRFGASDLTDSDRVQVGASCLAYNADRDEPRIGFFAAGNYKDRLSEFDYDPRYDIAIPKICAETSVLMAAGGDSCNEDFCSEQTGEDISDPFRVRHYVMEKVNAVVVVSSGDEETIKGITGVASRTLHPCSDCRRMFKHNPMIDSDTSIITLDETENIMQIQTVAELFDAYKGISSGTKDPKNYEDAPVYIYDKNDWALIAAVHKWLLRKRGVSFRGADRQADRRVAKRSRALAREAMSRVLEPVA